MQRHNFFLKTKLLPPRSVPDLLERPRLISKLEANIGSPVTIVAADAGCGKTTLVSDYLRRQGRPSVWYQLDHTDADPYVFIGYITTGIRGFLPEFGEAVISYLAEAGEELLQFPERAADLLLNEILDKVESPFILVLDDYHHIGRETSVHKFVDRLLQYSSEILHVVITTRDLPPLTIARRRAHSTGMIIGRDDLLFTDEEVRELFKNTLGVELRDDELAEYRVRTHGWITALQLVRQVAEKDIAAVGGDVRPSLGDMLERSERDIFDYFAEEVFNRESEQVRELMLRLALLDPMPLDTCGALFPEMRCSAQLPVLAQNNVFITVAGDGSRNEVYRFHPLFRDFLIRRLRTEVGQAQVASERARIGEYFLELGQLETALPFFLDAGRFERAAGIIAERGREWLVGGAFISLGLFADRVPAADLAKHPRAILFQAEVARLQGDTDRAVVLLNRAEKLLAEAGDQAGQAEALHSLASLARRRGRCDQAFALLDRSEALTEADSDTFMKCANTRGLCLIAEGKWAEAEQQFRLALDLAERTGDEHYIRIITHNLALAPGFRGDFAEALKWFRRIFQDGKKITPFPQEAIGHLNVARLHLYRGEFEESEPHLQRSLELSQLFGLRSLMGEILEAFGNFYRERNDTAHAAEYYDRALRAYEEADVNTAWREIDEERSKLHLWTGEFAKAKQILTSLIEDRAKAGNSAGVFTARSLLARVRLAAGDIEGVIEEVNDVLSFFRRDQHYYEEVQAQLTLALAYWRDGQLANSIEPIRRILDLSARFEYDYWLGREVSRLPEFFSQEEIAAMLPSDLGSVLAAPAIPAVQAAQTAASQPAKYSDLTIRVIGPVEIYRDPTLPLPADAWTTRRSRDIFCYIATSKHRRVAKDLLIDTFWRDEEPSVVEKNFHPTISHIRKALNSGQPFKLNFLVFRDGCYQLNPELTYDIDAEELDRMISDAESAKRDKDQERLKMSLERAYALCRGEFMPGVYEDWAEERRKYYLEQSQRVASALAKLSFAEKRWAAALKFSAEVLKEDPYREDMHRLIMKVHAAQAKPAAVKKHFEDLKDLLKQELGIGPSAETRRLMDELVGE